MKHVAFHLIVALSLLHAIGSNATADPVDVYDASMVVRGWLGPNPYPLGVRMSRQLTATEAFADEYGETIYYVVSFAPSGFVIVAPDDRITTDPRFR